MNSIESWVIKHDTYWKSDGVEMAAFQMKEMRYINFKTSKAGTEVEYTHTGQTCK